MKTRRSNHSDWRIGAVIVSALTLTATGWLMAADHDEAPAIQEDRGADIADVYAFESPTDPNNLVLAMTLSDVAPPSQIELGQSVFDPQVLYEFKIDNTGDAVEDLVIQAYVEGSPRNQVMNVRGPVAPAVLSPNAQLLGGPVTGSVRVSTGLSAVVSSRQGVTLFAGVRDDPFFFDFGQFSAILAGQAGSFNDPGTDSFAGLNVYAIVIELPKASIPNIESATVWGTTSR